ncbi:extracellular solute-binding protein [Cuspidothrix issatschenkoi]|uniref:ABC transporter substrate-binding protein n=1 Tax=Cuspidothrix issatschenkoi CHARLIE-1 TaxID=2052836 RepID=A0A2S6CWQ2_9CYAN|nr:extracellular solute-binding protein [Cuspidothrix issatschenkoi]PPJ64203.1 ABC transporter substrate-binding protein [Cuspidothrix issatschenkoi CHARLIE-1]
MKNPNFLNQLSGLLQRIRLRPHKLTVPLFTVALGLSTTLYACQSSAQREITLCFAVHNSENWKQLTEKFNNDNKGEIEIKFHPVSKGEDLKSLYLDSFKNSDPNSNKECNENSKYHLVYTDIIWLPEFAHKKYLLPLDKDFEEGELQDFLQTEIDNGKYKSKLYRIPFRTDVGVLYYNKDLLGKEKVPTTFKDLLDIAIKIKAKKESKIQYLWQADEEGLVAMFVEVLDVYRGFWIENNKVGLDQDKAIKAVKFLRETIKQKISFSVSVGVTQTRLSDEEIAKKIFLDGDSAFLRSWPGVWAEAQNLHNLDSKVQGRIGIAPVVGGKGCHGGWGLAIARDIEKERQKAAIKVVKFLTSRESQLLFTLSHASVPTRKDLFFDPLIVKKYSHYPELFTMMQKMVSRPRLARYEEVSKILQKSLQDALDTKTKDDAVEGIMKKASEETQDLRKIERK